MHEARAAGGTHPLSHSPSTACAVHGVCRSAALTMRHLPQLLVASNGAVALAWKGTETFDGMTVIPSVVLDSVNVTATLRLPQ
jgi:hypothetical protein